MGCFSLGIFAQFTSMLRDRGTVSYRRLHWGAGAIGHLLYLQGNLSQLRLLTLLTSSSFTIAQRRRWVCEVLDWDATLIILCTIYSGWKDTNIRACIISRVTNLYSLPLAYVTDVSLFPICQLGYLWRIPESASLKSNWCYGYDCMYEYRQSS